jgi:predicted amidohydrolase
MDRAALEIAIVHEVFWGLGADARLTSRLRDARRLGAELAVLPELPLDPWIPAARVPRDGDAERPGGPRATLLSRAARRAGIGVLGGAIVRDSTTGKRHNRALVVDASGALVAAYDKLHVPSEDGYWESDHYEPGEAAPRRIDAFGLPVGIQICSDLQRPEGSHLLGALGAMAILAPRATPAESYDRWKTVIRADAITSCAYVVSVNRPSGDSGAPVGGPSIAVAPNGDVRIETTEPLTRLSVERSVIEDARRDYPGYLAVRAELYARAWRDIAGRP